MMIRHQTILAIAGLTALSFATACNKYSVDVEVLGRVVEQTGAPIEEGEGTLCYGFTVEGSGPSVKCIEHVKVKHGEFQATIAGEYIAVHPSPSYQASSTWLTFNLAKRGAQERFQYAQAYGSISKDESELDIQVDRLSGTVAATFVLKFL